MSVIRPQLDAGEEIRRHPALGAFVALVATLANITLAPYLGHTPALLVYLAALVLAGPALDRTGVFVQAGLSVLAWDFFFTEPRFSFVIRGKEDVALAVLFVATTFAVARSAHLSRRHADAAARESERLRALREIVRAIAYGHDRRTSVDAALRRLGEAYDATATFFVFGGNAPSDDARVFGDTPVSGDLEEVLRITKERLPLDRFVELPDPGPVQDFVLSNASVTAVLRLRFRVTLPDDADRTEIFRLVAHLLTLSPENRSADGK